MIELKRNSWIIWVCRFGQTGWVEDPKNVCDLVWQFFWGGLKLLGLSLVVLIALYVSISGWSAILFSTTGDLLGIFPDMFQKGRKLEGTGLSGLFELLGFFLMVVETLGLVLLVFNALLKVDVIRRAALWPFQKFANGLYSVFDSKPIEIASEFITSKRERMCITVKLKD